MVRMILPVCGVKWVQRQAGLSSWEQVIGKHSSTHGCIMMHTVSVLIGKHREQHREKIQ